jgi:hypothetical protein
VFAQEDSNAINLTFFRGNVMPHTPDLYHLQGHPNGLMLDFIKQTHGSKEWHNAYNFPEYGVFVLYQNFNNEQLGQNISVGALYNFYFLNRNIKLRVSQGIGYASSPYDRETNSKNKAFGSTIVANTNLGFSYKKENLFKNVGFEAGILFTHYSNGRIKAPNSGINTYGINVGFNYNFDSEKTINDTITFPRKKITEPIKYNFVLRTGINESAVINSGQYPFFHISAYADKRINRKSALQLGTELFLTTSFKDFIPFKAVAYPNSNTDPNTDYKRVGVIVGHELFINKISLETQMGYYIYDPFKNEIPVYNRVGMKYYFTKKMFTGFTIKTHMFLAEALEFGFGVRL